MCVYSDPYPKHTYFLFGPIYLLHKPLISDAFTDTGISKYNGEPNEKNMKELEPWIGDTEIEVGGLDAEKSVSKFDLL